LFSLSSLKCLPKYVYHTHMEISSCTCTPWGISVFCDDAKLNWMLWKDEGKSKRINIWHSLLSIIFIVIQTNIFCITSWWSNSTCMPKALDAYISLIATWFEKCWFILIITCLFRWYQKHEEHWNFDWKPPN